MLTFDSILEATRQKGAHGEGKHYFAGRPRAGRLTGPAPAPSSYRDGRHDNREVRIRKDADGRIQALDIRTGERRWVRLILLQR